MVMIVFGPSLMNLRLATICLTSDSNLSVAAPAEPRGEKKHFFVQILGGEKLLIFVETCR